MLTNEVVRTAPGQVDRNRGETLLLAEFEIVEFEGRFEFASATTPNVLGIRASHDQMVQAPHLGNKPHPATP